MFTLYRILDRTLIAIIFPANEILTTTVIAKGKGAAIFEIAEDSGTAGGPETFLGGLFAHFGKEMLGW